MIYLNINHSDITKKENGSYLFLENFQYKKMYIFERNEWIIEWVTFKGGKIKDMRRKNTSYYIVIFFKVVILSFDAIYKICLIYDVIFNEVLYIIAATSSRDISWFSERSS